MINIEIDGIWCRECREMHPTLMWHEKYNDYELDRKEKWEKMKNKHFPNENIEYKDSLPLKELEQSENLNECIICKTLTYFKNLKTEHYVCSDECKYKDNERKEG